MKVLKKSLCFVLLAAIFFSVFFCANTSNVTSIFCAANKISQDNIKKCPIIMYHNTVNGRNNKYNVRPNMLESDFLYIKQSGFTPVFLRDVVDFCKNNKPLPEKPIVITFDDGCYNNFCNAFPILKKHNIKSTHSIVGGYTEKNYKDGVLKPTCSHMDYENLKEMRDSGIVEFGNHTYDMHKNRGRIGIKKLRKESEQEYAKTLKEDLQKCQNTMIENLGIEPKVMTFPFGEYNDVAIGVLKELGFDCALTCNEQINKLSSDTNLFELKRYNRTGNKSTKSFFDKIFDKCK